MRHALAPPTLQEYLARATQNQAQGLLAAARAVPEDQWDWKPFEQGRTVIDLIAECAMTNALSIQLLQERVWDGEGRAERRKAQAALDTPEKATAKLLENTAALVATIRQTSDSSLTLEIVLPGETTTVAEDLLHSYWNMAYHEGQINYIAMLAEERERREHDRKTQE